MILVLDSGPLGLATNPTSSSVDARECVIWLQRALVNQYRVIVPEIADYELRRVLIRGNKQEGLRRLDALIATLTYDPITTPAMRKAAEFWARARQMGRPSAQTKLPMRT
jgi:predicted nucleic acid-binding protein